VNAKRDEEFLNVYMLAEYKARRDAKAKLAPKPRPAPDRRSERPYGALTPILESPTACGVIGGVASFLIILALRYH
jgi:hypothetical protein